MLSVGISAIKNLYSRSQPMVLIQSVEAKQGGWGYYTSKSLGSSILTM